MDLTPAITALAALILGSAFFSGAESAFTSLSPEQLAVIRSSRGKKGILVYDLMGRPNHLLSTILIGNNLMNIAASALATHITIRLFGSAAVGIMTGVLTLIMLVFAEITPKQVALANNEFISLHTARVLYILSRILMPLIVVLGGFSRLAARVGGGEKRRHLTMEGLLHIIRHAENAGILEQYKSRAMKNLFRFSDIPVSAVMTHRTDVVSLDQTTPIREALKIVGETGHSRIPVYDRDPEHIVGVIVTQDLIRTIAEPERPIKAIMMDPMFVPEYRRIDQAMNQILQAKLNLAIVLDEYGGLSGIVSLEDILEEIIGEIYDEHEPREGSKIIPLGENRYSIRADIPLSVINDFLPVPLKTRNSDVHTLGGYIGEILGRIPGRSERIRTVAGEFTVTRIKKNRLIELTWTRPEQNST
ncbi:Hemolysin, contains CBS domains [Alkalispirochaeta americana]|uniref:Hemolysin, contains CBS domains n=1 Tax=Alkalispirochaeta americana TaxID=159291 RepID=A0A1N6TVQ4_9SPIO|nr:hemolysin family protein [Alkalispirochaeta americana]SIQ57453.1 Hemolysin, contains CBS domains [Alkalispirochaeta americana]